MINIKVLKDYEEMSKVGAQVIREFIETTEAPVLGLATGSSPEGLYAELVRMHKEENLDFSNVQTVNLDEYVGLGGNHDQSYRYFMNHHLFDHVNINKEHTHVPNGMAEDLEQEAKDYDNLVQSLGVDVQLLGIGTNGHIGFNEPGEYLSAPTHVIALKQSTIDSNKKYFESEEAMPKTAITMGMQSIFSAKHIVLVAYGEKKAKVIAELADNRITTDNPATLLKLHPSVLVLCDQEAGKLLK